MITSKQRAFLRALAHPLDHSMQIGKDGINENSIIQVEQMLFAKELIKIK
ncbi:MAG: YhbY family RNA-binding protein, partial [Clostridia bacterium]|nr:YhbY family RNA-binding protein [Clostridia bacterium]